MTSNCLVRSRGFTLIELLVVISIIGVLIAMLLPSLGAARQSAWAVKCLANERSFGIGSAQYSNDFKGFLPVSGSNGDSYSGCEYEIQIAKYLGDTAAIKPGDDADAVPTYTGLRMFLDPAAIGASTMPRYATKNTDPSMPNASLGGDGNGVDWNGYYIQSNYVYNEYAVGNRYGVRGGPTRFYGWYNVSGDAIYNHLRADNVTNSNAIQLCCRNYGWQGCVIDADAGTNRNSTDAAPAFMNYRTPYISNSMLDVQGLPSVNHGMRGGPQAGYNALRLDGHASFMPYGTSTPDDWTAYQQ